MPRTSRRQGLAARRSLGAMAGGAIVVAVAFAFGAPWPVALSGGWGTMALLIVASVWLRIARMDAAQTKAHARAEDFSRPAADLAVLVASVASLGAIGYMLIEARRQQGGGKALLIALAIAVVGLSWATLHTLYTLRYGDLYYGDPIGGIDFNDDEPPDYVDFAYVALTIGMTFQVSDTSFTSKAMRRAAIRHALLSFVFVAVIVALAINSVGNLLQ